MRNGLIIVNIGNGKGKTTVVLGTWASGGRAWHESPYAPVYQRYVAYRRTMRCKTSEPHQDRSVRAGICQNRHGIQSIFWIPAFAERLHKCFIEFQLAMLTSLFLIQRLFSALFPDNLLCLWLIERLFPDLIVREPARYHNLCFYFAVNLNNEFCFLFFLRCSHPMKAIPLQVSMLFAAYGLPEFF